MNTQIERISRILGHPAMKTCFDCSKVYLPMNEITFHLCPFCQVDEIEEVKKGELKVILEEVSNDNDDMILFDNPESPAFRLKRSKGLEKSIVSKKIK